MISLNYNIKYTCRTIYIIFFFSLLILLLPGYKNVKWKSGVSWVFSLKIYFHFFFWNELKKNCWTEASSVIVFVSNGVKIWFMQWALFDNNREIMTMRVFFVSGTCVFAVTFPDWVSSEMSVLIIFCSLITGHRIV